MNDGDEGQLEADLERMGDSTMDVASAASEGGAAPGSVRRYALLARLGEGGMGVVYIAYDARLDRKIALKVLRREESPHARARFEREAQALARLKHPNVVTVYDAGAVGERPYLAMELIEGASLRRWLAERPRGWREVARVLEGAGRGLAAAHSAGLIHRDVKPDNILVGADGVARVADFGLVRLVGSPDDDDDAAPAQTPSGPRLTREGAYPGTPGYMAPDAVVDARSDQYSFCVTLREAIEGRGAPAFLRRLVERGTKIDPAERYPDMPALLADLGHDPGQAWRRLALGAALVVAAGAVALAARRVAPPPAASPCTGAAARLAGVWDGPVRVKLRTVFAESKKPYAAQSYARVATAFDDYARGWVAMRTEACEATSVRGEQSRELLDLRMACLDRRLGQLGALTAALAGSPAAIDRGPIAVDGLAPLAGCADAEALKQAYPLPRDATAQARIAGLRHEIDLAFALKQAGRMTDAAAASAPLVERARAEGYPPLLAEALFRHGDSLLALNKYAEAGPVMREALLAAARARDARLEGQAWYAVLRSEDGQAHYATVMALAIGAEAAVARSGDYPKLEARIHYQKAFTLKETGPLDEARREIDAAIALDGRDPPGKNHALATDLAALATILRKQGKPAEAAKALDQAAAIDEVIFGADHPAMAYNHADRGLLLGRIGQYAAAEAAHRRAMEIFTANEGAETRDASRERGNVAAWYVRERRYAEALAEVLAALAVTEKLLGKDNVMLAGQLETEMFALGGLGRWPEARAVAERDLPLRLQRDGPKHANVGQLTMFMALTSAELGKLDQAERETAQARAILAEAHEEDELLRLVWEARIRLAQRRPADALAVLARAAPLRGPDALDGAELDLLGARARWLAGQDRPAAAAAARELAARLATMGEPAQGLRREAEALAAAR